MIDLHTHTFASDGELGPAELVRRAAVAGYRALAITDHADQSNVVSQLRQLRPVVEELGDANGLCLLAGVELTHVPPRQIAAVVALARANRAQLVLVHGETIVEPVIAGTNRAAIEAGVDILAHPGLISAEDVQLAAEKGVFLEITTRKGHSLTNGHVAKMAEKYGAKLVVNNDAHAPGDLVSLEMARKIARGAGLTEAQFEAACQNSFALVERSRNADK
ncbi:MAG: histidinol phosphate phosphatase domain-containing protein [Deltaproteobacteria bacterium]|nr:histidinol phosphate phosphatase domain-containing protein [Deltaproteobacteria bacterium]NCP04360.1 histidinol phosphate phosphatase domain-containing protein [Deltaproteobacteria bacterium]